MSSDRSQIISISDHSAHTTIGPQSRNVAQPLRQVRQKHAPLLTSWFSSIAIREKITKNCTSHWSIPQSNQHAAAVIIAQTSKHRTLTSILNTTLPLLSQNSEYFRSAYQKSHSPTWKITRAHNTSIKELRTRTKNGNRENYFASFPRKKIKPLLPTSICCASQMLWPHFKVIDR